MWEAFGQGIISFWREVKEEQAKNPDYWPGAENIFEEEVEWDDPSPRPDGEQCWSEGCAMETEHALEWCYREECYNGYCQVTFKDDDDYAVVQQLSCEEFEKFGRDDDAYYEDLEDPLEVAEDFFCNMMT